MRPCTAVGRVSLKNHRGWGPVQSWEPGPSVEELSHSLTASPKLLTRLGLGPVFCAPSRCT